MKKILSLLPLVICKAPAYASPLLAAMEATREFKIEKQELDLLRAYLHKSAILYSVKCEENRAMWYCEAPILLQRLSRLKEIKNEKTSPEPAPK